MNSQPSPADLALQWLDNSPFVLLLGMEVEAFERDKVIISIPFKEDLVTIADVVHGGAISSLIDTAAAAAAWSGAEQVTSMRGTTISLNVSFLSPARSTGIKAEARCVKRGKTICFCEVEVTTADGEVIAQGMVTYKLG